MSRVTLPSTLTPHTLAKASDVLADLAALVAVINGGLDDTNIATGANIATAKLASDAGIVAAMLAALAVTTPKIAVGATIAARVQQPINSGQSVSALATICTLPAITTRGGVVKIRGAVYGSVATLSSNMALSFTLLRDGVPIEPFGMAGIQVGTFPIGAPVVVDDAPAAGTYVYSLQANPTSGLIFITSTTGAPGPGRLIATEYA